MKLILQNAHACRPSPPVCVSAASAAVETYAIDPVHSSVAFSVRHFLTRVPGHFAKFTGTITVDRDNLENSSVVAAIDVGSVSTDNEKRDDHLKSPDFFDAAKFDSITFKSTSWKKTGEGTFDVAGDLTIHGVTKPVVLKVDLLGFGPGMMGGAALRLGRVRHPQPPGLWRQRPCDARQSAGRRCGASRSRSRPTALKK